MQVVVIADEILKDELTNNSSVTGEIIWIEDISQLEKFPKAGVIIDLLFEIEHLSTLQNLVPHLVIVNCVEKKLSQINSSFIRINGWPGFLQSSIIEASTLDESNKPVAENIFALFKKKLEWLPDEVGFVTPRVISMIINEAFIALKEGVSTKEEIDIAMKLGTNYPYGPFEWYEKIGTQKVDSLLHYLQKENNSF
jgi:3-hydroxybutyryl-CoA dehydrogenase